MVNRCYKPNFGWLEWVVAWEFSIHLEQPSLVWSLLWAKQQYLPQSHVLTWIHRHERMGIALIVCQLLHDPLK